jgi:2-C-methyl-D-erythritol 2,4-cyclodiphosphate synthase
MLGAIAAPDIGTLFSPSDPRWKGAESSVFVTEAMWRVKAAGYAIVNVDSTLIMAQPKIGPHTANIRAKISALIGIPPDRIGIKAKTPEGLGIQNTAIAHAVVLMAKESGPRRRAKKKSRS